MTRLSWKQYGRRSTAAMAVYIALMLLVWPQARHESDLLVKTLLALVPALPMLYVIWLMLRRILASDELEQRTHLIGLGAATGASAVYCLVCGFLAAAQLFSLDSVAMILFWVFPLQMLSYGAMRVWAARRYGSDGDCVEEGGMTMAQRLGIAGVLFAIAAAWCWWRGFDDFRVGLMSGIAAALLAAALVFRLRRRRRGSDASQA